DAAGPGPAVRRERADPVRVGAVRQAAAGCPGGEAALLDAGFDRTNVDDSEVIERWAMPTICNVDLQLRWPGPVAIGSVLGRLADRPTIAPVACLSPGAFRTRAETASSQLGLWPAITDEDRGGLPPSAVFGSSMLRGGSVAPVAAMPDPDPATL